MPCTPAFRHWINVKRSATRWPGTSAWPPAGGLFRSSWSELFAWDIVCTMRTYAEFRGHAGANRLHHRRSTTPPILPRCPLRRRHTVVQSASPSTENATAIRTAGSARTTVRLDILRIDVSAADDDQVLDPARDEEFTRPEETQITGAQVLALLAGESGVEHLAGQFGPVVIAGGDASPRHPDLADHTVIHARAVGGVDDSHRVLAVDLAAADHHAAHVRAASGSRSVRYRVSGPLPRDEQRRLRHPVAGNQRLGVEPERCRGLLRTAPACQR